MTLGGMKNSWTTTIAVAAVIGLLTLFLAMQYNWQAQASAAERESMQKRVGADARNFADDFNREIQGAYFNFQIDPEPVSRGDAAELAERFAYWKKNTQFPELISEIVYFPGSGEARAHRFDPETKSFTATPVDGKLSAIMEKARSERRPSLGIDDLFALVVPLHPLEKQPEQVLIRRTRTAEPPPHVELPAAAGYVAVFLNEAVIRDEMLPAIAARHFQPNEYGISVSDHAGNTFFKTAEISNAPDAAAGLFDLAPDNLVFFASREVMRQRSPDNAPNVVVDQHVERRSLSEEVNTNIESDETFTIHMKEEGSRKRTAVIAGKSDNESPWKLNVQHAAGSIDNYIKGERNKSFLVGLGIYALLVGSILAIVFSSMRVRRYAQRQIDFVSSVSHEFRTPLAVIYSAGENLADGVTRDEEQVSRYGDLIKGEGKKLSAMVEQILEFAGARSRKRQYNLAAGDVSSAVTTALEDSEPLLDAGGFDVETSMADNLPNIQIDREAIETAVRNLIQNAVKYSNGTRWLRVSTQNGGGSIKIVVEDRGIGIAPSDRKKIFQPFYRAKDVVDAQIHGNGLGLSLVKEIAEAHGGRIGVTSDVGTGSRFVMTLPIQS